MSAAVACYPASPVHLKDSCVLSCTEEPSNDDAAFDNTKYPASPQIVYRFRLSKAGEDDLVSEEFSTNAGGEHEWPGILFPVAGTWKLDLEDTSDDSVVDTANITVQ